MPPITGSLLGKSKMRTYSLKSDSVRQLFDSVAPRYDFLNHLLSLRRDVYWRKRAIRELRGVEGSILDLATGTGDLALEMACRNVGQRRIVGLDFSEPMLRKAAQKIMKRNLAPTIILALGDALQLPFENDTFDASMIAFGLRNIPEKEKALAEMARVTKPAGKIVILEFTIPRKGPIKKLYAFYFANILPRIGGLVSGDKAAYTYLPESVFRFQSPKDYEELMRRAGLDKVTSFGLTCGIASIMVGAKKHS